MPGANELLIKINADAKNAKKAFDDVKKQTEDLQSTLDRASLAGAAVFAALSAEVFLSVRAFSDATQASNQLSQALQNQGIFTTELKEQYKGFAEVLQSKTGIDDDQIIRAEAIAQSYLGQTKITQQLAGVIVDLGEKLGSLDEAAQLVGRTIGTSTNALARNGVAIREGSTESQRYAQVLQQLNLQVGDQAEQANKATFGVRGLKTAFGNLQEEVGKRFAPFVEAAATALTRMFEAAQKNDKLLDFAAALIAGVGAAAAFVALAGPVVAGFTAIAAALAAAGVVGGALTATMFAIPAAIAVVVAGVVYLALNWEKSMLRMRAATTAVVTYFTEAFGNAFSAIAGLFTGKLSIADALKKLLSAPFEAGSDAIKKYNDTVDKGLADIEKKVKTSEEKQNAAKKAAADKANKEKVDKENRERAAKAAEDALKLLQVQKASDAEIAIAQKRAAFLKDAATSVNKGLIAAEQARAAELAQIQAAQHADDLQRTVQFAREKQQAVAEVQAEGFGAGGLLLNERLDALKSQVQTEQDINDQAAVDRLTAKIAADNLFLADQKKFGTTYATINKVSNSEIYKGMKQAFGDLAELQQSSNSTLKAIGKGAAIANVIIKTREAAMNIYAGFSTIPIIGPELGIAGAAAAIAFGAEQLGAITAAAHGALVGGASSRGGTGDSHPFMLEKGELVAPARNFDQVVNGVQTERSGVIDELRQGLADISARIGNGAGMVVHITGDVLADDGYIDRFAQKVSDAVQFRNVRFVASGVNA